MTNHLVMWTLSSMEQKGNRCVWFQSSGSVSAKYTFNFSVNFLSSEDRACSHTQSLLFWAEAVRSNASTVFPARRCNNYSEFQSNTCDTNTPIAYINAKTPATTARGSYFLNTFQYSPYSKATANPWNNKLQKINFVFFIKLPYIATKLKKVKIVKLFNF